MAEDETPSAGATAYPVSLTEPLPLILTDAGLTISGKDLACVTNHLELSPDVTITTLDTFCGSTDYPGVVKWSLIATLYQSFDADATEDVLSEAVAGGVPVPFTIVPYKSQPVSATNPEWSGELIPQPYAPINGDAGDASSRRAGMVHDRHPGQDHRSGLVAAGGGGRNQGLRAGRTGPRDAGPGRAR